MAILFCHILQLLQLKSILLIIYFDKAAISPVNNQREYILVFYCIIYHISHTGAIQTIRCLKFNSCDHLIIPSVFPEQKKSHQQQYTGCDTHRHGIILRLWINKISIRQIYLYGCTFIGKQKSACFALDVQLLHLMRKICCCFTECPTVGKHRILIKILRHFNIIG